MAGRVLITDAAWAEIAARRAAIKHKVGRPADLRDRRGLEVVMEKGDDREHNRQQLQDRELIDEEGDACKPMR
jgi:hypothetical protein